MIRATIKQLENRIDQINSARGFSGKPLWNRVGNRNVATVGMMYLDQAYGGCNLAEIVTESGGIRCPLGYGMRTKRELLAHLDAYIAGMRA